MSPDRSTPVALEIVRGSKLWNDVPGVDATIASAVSAVFDEARLVARPEAELVLALSNDREVRRLNAKWRGKNSATNVLTFPAFGPDEISDAPMLGDVVIAFETVAREADEEGKRFVDHLSHLVVHGVLHVFGYDHLHDGEAEAMEALETRALARLGIADPYAVLDPAPAA